MAGAMAGTAILNAGLTKSLHTVTLTINNDCNLSCPHCYLQYQGSVSIIADDLISFICEDNFEHLAIVGKEPLYNSESLAICEKIAERAVAKSKTVSLITNGLNLSLIKPRLLEHLSYIDLSLDGGPATYSQYRKASLSKILSGLEHLRRNGFKNVNALHVLNTRTADNVDDMMRVKEFFDFRRVMFSPYVKTSNFGANAVDALEIEALLSSLSRSELFMSEPNAVLLVGTENLPPESGRRDNVLELANRYGLAEKIHHIAEDPLLYGIIRVTFDGYVLTPYQSLHTTEYRKVGRDISKVDLRDLSLGGIYQAMRIGHDHIPLCN
jgi:MoaA/NifB/PqqE/SkfB family radical SAM enzyme